MKCKKKRKKEILEMPFYIKCGSAAVWKYCGVRSHSHNADAAATVDQFFQHSVFFCVCQITFLRCITAHGERQR